MPKFLHAADIHLDSPMQGLERYDGAPVERLRGATRQALVNLVEMARTESFPLVLLAGDLYDGDWKDYNTGLFFVKQMALLREANVRVVLIAGNHDAANKMTRSLKWPDNVKVLSCDAPETYVLDDLGIAVHGQGFARQEEKHNLAANYPAAHAGYFNIGLLHTCLDGREGHQPYAPCTLDGLRNKQYDYWALGHVHTREILHRDPWIVFPGNTQGRSIRETGPRGCMAVTIARGVHVDQEFRSLDVVRWEKCQIDATPLATPEEVLNEATERMRDLVDKSEGRPLAVRVEVHGSSACHGPLLADRTRWINEIRARSLDVGTDALWIEKVKLLTTSPPASMALDGPLGEVYSVLDELRRDDRALASLAEGLEDLDGKLLDELKHGPDGLRVTDLAWLRGLLDQAPPLITSRLLPPEKLS